MTFITAIFPVFVGLVAALSVASCNPQTERTEEKLPVGVGVEVGAVAPDFRVANTAGGTMTLSEHRGKVVLINFWATWCGPCRAEMPSMEALYRSHLQHSFEILAISIDTGSPSRVRAYVDDFGFTFPVLLDADYRVNDLYQVRVAPTSFLIDRQGRIVRKIPGAKDWNHPEVRAWIDQLIDAPQA
jgi:peroxiredoxin